MSAEPTAPDQGAQGSPGFARARRRLRRAILLRGADGIPKLQTRSGPDFERLSQAVRKMGTDSLEHFGNGYTFEGGLALQQHPDELAALCVCLRERRPLATYVEIGSASGGVCLALQREVGFERCLAIDDGQHARASEQPANFAQVPSMDLFTGNSHSERARDFLSRTLNVPIDVALVDGDHSHEGVVADVRLVLGFSRPGTLVILHDIVACEGVDRAWIQFLRSGALEPVAEYVGQDRPLGIAVGSVSERRGRA